MMTSGRWVAWLGCLLSHTHVPSYRLILIPGLLSPLPSEGSIISEKWEGKKKKKKRKKERDLIYICYQVSSWTPP